MRKKEEFKQISEIIKLMKMCIILTCGMIASLDLSSCNQSLLTLIPSIHTFPLTASMIRNSESVKLLFLAPVLPQMQTFSWGSMVKSMPFNTRSSNKVHFSKNCLQIWAFPWSNNSYNCCQGTFFYSYIDFLQLWILPIFPWKGSIIYFQSHFRAF